MERISTARGVCPACNRNLPFSKAFWGLGKVFACRGCGGSLFIPKAQMGMAIGSFALVFGLSRILPVWLVIGFAIVIGYFDWLFLRVYLVKDTPDDNSSIDQV